LIVEDDSDTRLAYHILLKVKRYDTYFAKDPLSCLWGAQTPPGSDHDGSRLNRRRRIPHHRVTHDAGHLANIPDHRMSAGDVQTFKPRAMEIAAQAYFQKPVEQARLMETISRLNGESGDSVVHRFLELAQAFRNKHLNIDPQSPKGKVPRDARHVGAFAYRRSRFSGRDPAKLDAF
jgi:hypothetical protein